MRIISLLLTVLILTGCSGLQALNLVTPHSGYDVRKDIAYGDLPRQKLDVYLPKTPEPGHNVILFFYGGSWQEGSRDLYRFVGQSFASKGYVTVIADYRTYPEAYYPDFVSDAAKAFVWLHKHANEYGGNASRIFVAGHSAGAHIAMMMMLDPKYISDAGGDAGWIKGTIGLAGPYDFLPFTDPKIIALFSKVPDAATQPINFVRKGTPPVLLLTGEADDEVSPANSVKLAKALLASHDSVVLHTYQGVSHTDIVLSLAQNFHDRAPALRDILDFINQQ